jgi:hypothetical protein
MVEAPPGIIIDEEEYYRYRENDLEHTIETSNFVYFWNEFCSICCVLCCTQCLDTGCPCMDCICAC